MREQGLFFIGEISKMVGVSVKSLRYYEQLGLLIPAYVNPSTNYRYYSFKQLYLIEIIQTCLDIDIKLRNLTQFIEDGVVDYEGLLAFGKKIAEEKLASVTKGLQFIDQSANQLETIKKYQLDVIYEKAVPEKAFYVLPCQSFDIDHQLEIAKAFASIPFASTLSMPEYGYLLIHAKGEIKRYVFMEVQLGTKGENIKKIPAGIYFFNITEQPNIENSEETFKEVLHDKESFIVIETELFASKYKIDTPFHEVRVLSV